MNRNILNLRQLTVLLILCTAFLGGIIPAFAQQGGKKITGQVIDENKEPMIGVSILIVGTSTGTVTDFDGNYTLNVPQGNKELQFSYVGYETKIVALPTSGSVLNVQMKSDSQVLSDVVVIGYGTQRKSDLTGSVTNASFSVTSAELLRTLTKAVRENSKLPAAVPALLLFILTAAATIYGIRRRTGLWGVDLILFGTAGIAGSPSMANSMRRSQRNALRAKS